MCTMLVFVSLREILLYAPDPVSPSTAVQGLSAEAKHKNNVCISYRDLLTHIFLLKSVKQTCYAMVCEINC